MKINLIIAENLKRLRHERNMSLGRLAAASDLSKVMLSQIERGKANPTINTLWKIATGLNVPYTALLEQQDKHPQIIRKKDIPPQQSPDQAYCLFNYYPNTPARNFELFQMALQEGGVYTSVGHPEKSEEYIVVLEGELTLKVRHKTFLLEAEDAITFSAEDEHTYLNTGSGTLKTLIINFYPQ